MQYNPSIDGLRAIAVLAVIANHFSSNILPSGFLGVDIFFVISGYVITQSMSNRSYTSLPHLMSEFFSRRIKRLTPALIFFVAITSLAMCFFNPTPASSLKTGAAALLGVSNIFLITQAADYFGDSVKLNAFTHTWSLGVEEQFYIVFPLLIWFCGFSTPAHSTSRLFKTLTALAIASLLFFVYLSISAPKVAYFLMPARFWELAAGCLTFILQKNIPNKKNIGMLCMPALMGILAIQFAPESLITESTIAVIALTSLTLYTLNSSPACYNSLSISPIRYIGKISYSLYLWHWGVIVLSKWTIGMQGWMIPFQLAMIAALSTFSYHMIESPLRKASWSKTNAGTILKGALISFACLAALIALIKPLNGHFYLGAQPTMIARGVSSLTESYKSADGSIYWQPEKCVLENNSDIRKTINPEDCSIGNFNSAEHRILVLGNSFSAAFAYAFEGIVKNHRHAVVLTSSWGASPISGIKNNSSWQEANKYYWESVAPQLISQLQENDWVFLLSDLATLLPSTRNATSKNLIEQYKANVETLAQALIERKIKLAILAPLPLVREVNCAPAATIPQWFSPFGGPCKYPARTDIIERTALFNSILTELQDKGTIRIVNVFDIFCPGKHCTYTATNGKTLYRDEWSHPSVEAAQLAAPAFENVFLSNPNR